MVSRSQSWTRIRSVGALLIASAAARCAAPSTEPATFFEQRTVKLVVGYGPGGGFDSYARLIAGYLEKELAANVVVENRPGGGGLTALNQLVRGSNDGTSIMLVHGEAALLAQLVGRPGVRYDIGSLQFLGRVSAEPRIVLMGARSPYRTVDHLLRSNRPIKFAAASKLDGFGDAASMMCKGLDLQCRLITGYRGSKEASLAVMRGEADGIVLTQSTSKSISRDGRLIPLTTLARERATLFPDLPTVFERVALGPDGGWWIDFRATIARVGRILVTGPDCPLDRVAYLRGAVRAVLTDPEVIDKAERIDRPIEYLTAEDTFAYIEEILGSLDLERLKSLRTVLLDEY